MAKSLNTSAPSTQRCHAALSPSGRHSPKKTCFRSMTSLLALLGLMCIASVPAQAGAGTPSPLSDKARQILHSSKADPSVVRSRHYVMTNETRHDLFRPFIKGIGGGYIGIASDQNYTLIAYARSQFAWLIDYDAVIQDIHRVHRAMILASPDADTYLQHWNPKRRKATIALLRKTYGSQPTQNNAVKAYRNSQRRLWRYLNKRRKANAQSRPNWLNTPSLYSYIKAMFKHNRIRIMHGNLVGQNSIYGIGQAAKRAGVPIRVFYTSNAEEWVKYRAPFRRNINALHVDQKSVMIRTLWIKMFQPRASDLWQYNIQKLQQFQRFLRKQDSWVGGLNQHMRLSHLWGTTLIGFPPGYKP